MKIQDITHLPGTTLKPGLYLRLSHGRDRKDEDMNDWGFDGPSFGPLTRVGRVYDSHLVLDNGQETIECHTPEDGPTLSEDMVMFDGKYYGEYSVEIVT